MRDEVLVLDFGSQYNQLIARRIRDLGVYSELVSYDIDIKNEVKNKNIVGIILSGGPNSVYENGSFKISDEIFSLGIPVLGICYGMQLISFLLGGEVKSSNVKEYGGKEIEVLDNSSLLIILTGLFNVALLSIKQFL